jgi:hypothetical protein
MKLQLSAGLSSAPLRLLQWIWLMCPLSRSTPHSMIWCGVRTLMLDTVEKTTICITSAQPQLHENVLDSQPLARATVTDAVS